MKRVLLEIAGWHMVSTVILDDGLYETAVFKRDKWDAAKDFSGRVYDYANPVYMAQFVTEKEARKAHKKAIKDIIAGMKGARKEYIVLEHVYGR